ncbi:MAG: class I SAM-dependent methyltransferase [Ahrensia sp.]|nr:class I SAM-dependent methyltransferase [Ahrensia sp.]
MAGDVRHTLLLPFVRQHVPPPSKASPWLFVNARPLPAQDFIQPEMLVCQQGFRPIFRELQVQAYEVVAQFERSEITHGALLLLGRNRKLNEHNLTSLWNNLPSGACLVCAGDKTAGIGAVRKWVASLTPVVGSLSKHHAQVFWCTRSGEAWPTTPINNSVHGYTIAPGMFAAKGPDRASKLLVEHFDISVGGKVADLGAGWGYLSAELLKCGGDASLHLFEADHASLEAARKNLAVNKGADIRFHWHDVIEEPINESFDWVIMNPPFHPDRKADSGLGKSFIDAAARILVPGGRLLMVANTHLPYEQRLRQSFKHVEPIAQRDGFKVIRATR